MSEEQTGETKEFNKLLKALVVTGALIATVYGLLFLKYRQPQLFGIEPVSSLNANHAVIDEDIQVYQAFLAQANADHELEQAFSKSGPGPSSISRADLNRKKIMLAGENYNTTVFRLVSDTVTSNKIGPLSKYLHYTHGGQKQDHDRYDSLRESLMDRNSTSVQIPQFTSPLPVTFSPVNYHRNNTKIGDMFSCDLHFSLPVYNADQTVAMVFFYSEEATTLDPGTIYILVKKGSSWIVDRQEFTGGSFIIQNI